MREPWTEWGSTVVSDALRSLGKAFQSLEGGFQAVDPSSRLTGPAFTVRCYPGATWALEQALELATPGDVLVIDAGGRPDLIIMGSLMSLRAKTRGIAGAIVDGAVRDIEEIVQLGFPVFSRYVSPRAGTHAQIGEWQTTICCGRVPVAPADWVVADRSGIAIVPREMIPQVAATSQSIFDREARIEKQLRAGATLADAARLEPLH